MKFFKNYAALGLLAVAMVFVSTPIAAAQVNADPLNKYYSSNGNLSSPQGVTQIQPGTVQTNSSGNVANASAIATLTPSATQVAYITGFVCDPGGSTSAALVNITIVGVLGGTMTRLAATPAGAALAGSPVSERFSPPIPASAINTPIVVTMPALGTGNLKADCVATGFVW